MDTMTGPNEMAARVARSTVAEGWARLSVMLIVPIILAMGSWVIYQSSEFARMGERVSHIERDTSGNSSRIEALVIRLGANDSAQARVEAELGAMRQSLSRVEEMLTIIVRERRSNLNSPRREIR